jgi:hypothetical protein
VIGFSDWLSLVWTSYVAVDWFGLRSGFSKCGIHFVFKLVPSK